jgi:large subunit ribosomal protein L22
MFKRIQPRARGTAFGIKRRMAHIIVTLTDVEAMAEAAERQKPEANLPAAPALQESAPAPAN